MFNLLHRLIYLFPPYNWMTLRQATFHARLLQSGLLSVALGGYMHSVIPWDHCFIMVNLYHHVATIAPPG